MVNHHFLFGFFTGQTEELQGEQVETIMSFFCESNITREIPPGLDGGTFNREAFVP